MTILENVLPTDDNKTDDTQENLFEAFVGEGKKYKTPEDLAKGKAHADKFIDTLIAEKRELEAKLIATTEHQKTMHEILEELKKNGQPTPSTSTQTPSTPQINTEDISSLIASELEKRQAETLRKAQVEKVKAQLITEFGDINQAKAVITSYAQGDPDKLAAIDKLVVSDFATAVKILKEHSGPENQTFTDSSQVKKVIIPSNMFQGLTWSKAEAIRKSDPRTYRSRDFQVAMHKAASLNPNFLNQ